MKPTLKIKNGEYFVTDGEIDGSKFIVKKQPSKSTIDYLQGYFLKEVLIYQQEGK